MCELFALSASQPVDIKLSLAELARHGGETGIHGDGWGVAYLEGRDARLFREPSAAAFSPWVRCVQEHPLRSDTVIAHIRHATKGAITLANTQPFARELEGRIHVFAHNGDLGDMLSVDVAQVWRFQPIGETDSEVAFCLLLERIAANRELEEGEAANRVFKTFAHFASEMRDRGPANIIYASNGRLLVHADRRTQRPGVVEPPGLWMLQRQCRATSEPAFAGGGVSVTGAALNVVLIASVPLTSEPWRPLERGTVLDVQKGQRVADCSI
jgi:predicted glutamine amidotransferase